MSRGLITDKWSMRILWACAVGSAISFFMVAQERQLQNRDKMLADSLNEADGGTGGEKM
ncbi:uncharacterized protein LOC124924009 [Impatiens glandulifera]|uniref:uncharacterized protein LOC124924009 n=1 Tax=Impatiens glandulifera TaxID=253017 RepID=UPI001FB0C36E|nr:uncharacterized protein LOC124924009 [Impatiens glandulifera]